MILRRGSFSSFQTLASPLSSRCWHSLQEERQDCACCRICHADFLKFQGACWGLENDDHVLPLEHSWTTKAVEAWIAFPRLSLAMKQRRREIDERRR
jgi:hypothetical protein